MIHEEPLIKPLGDCYLSVVLGDEASLETSFRGLALYEALLEVDLPGVVEITLTSPQLAVVFDRARTNFASIEQAVRSLLPTVVASDSLPSRLITMPMWYDDPWSAEVAERFGVQNNIQYVAELNNMSVNDVIALHSGTDHWVTLVGFVPGANVTFPLDANVRLTAPKYHSPRTFTPARTVALAGVGTCQYPVATPGGYQMLGRLAIDVYQERSTYDVFRDTGVLLKPGDRVRYKPVGPVEYEEIWHRAQRGEYEYDIVEEIFDIAGYLADPPVSTSSGATP